MSIIMTLTLIADDSFVPVVRDALFEEEEEKEEEDEEEDEDEDEEELGMGGFFCGTFVGLLMGRVVAREEAALKNTDEEKGCSWIGGFG